MRKLAVAVVALIAASAFGQMTEEEHLEHLRTMMHARSSHGPVIPQPDSIVGLATKTIDMTAVTFSFTPNQITVNQGDMVTLNISVPNNDSSPVSPAHILLMETYLEQGVACKKGQTVTVQFVATTPGTFLFVCNQPSCGEGHTSMIGQMIVNAATIPAPAITSVAPNVGSPAGGTPVTITGSNFQTSGTTVVRFDTTPATNVKVVDSNTITAVTPAHAEQTVGVRVTNPDGQIAALPMGFTFAALKINSVSPNSGSTSGGTSVTISGSGFQSGASVTFGGVAAQVTNVTSTSITVVTPLGPASEQLSVDVVVTNPDGTSVTAAGGFTYTVPSLSVNTVAPSSGTTSGGTIVTFTGQGFTSALASSVTFGGVAATNVTIDSPVSMHVTAPAHAAGTVDVTVTIGSSTVTKTGAFTYATPPPRHRAARH